MGALDRLYAERDKLRRALEGYAQEAEGLREELRALEGDAGLSANDLERSASLSLTLSRLEARAMELQKRLGTLEKQAQELEAQKAQGLALLEAQKAVWTPLFPHLQDLERAIADVSAVVGRFPTSARKEALQGVRMLAGFCERIRAAKGQIADLERKLAWYGG